MSRSSIYTKRFDPSRRRFVQGALSAGALASLPAFPGIASPLPSIPTPGIPRLSGKSFDLTVAETLVNFTGTPRKATTINGSIPGPILRWREGDVVTLRVTNHMPVSTSIHWHGILLPFQMDGVPGLSYEGIAPGQTFVYRFPVKQSGTYWYHSHTAFQEQTGMYGAIIIDPAAGDPIRADRDYVVQLSDWTDEDPMRVFAKLHKQSDYYNFNQLTVGGFLRDVSTGGLRTALQKRRMWNQMRMNPTDLSDISGYTYTYLMNGRTRAGNWTATYRSGERIRLRFINSAAQTFFDVRIPGLEMTVVQVDGQNVEPVSVEEFRIGVAETYDVLVTPREDAYTLFAQSMDRTGFARGTLATRPGLTAPVPALDEPMWLSMTDMMGDMSGDTGMPPHMMGGMSSNTGMPHMMGRMRGSEGTPGMSHDNPGMSGHHMPGMNHSAEKEHASQGRMRMASPPARANHARTEYGPSVDMRVDHPRTNLDDPGVGLRGNGRRVLTYADLHTIGGPIDPRDGEREIELHLTGNMERYTWSLDGLEFAKSTPVHFRYGERLRIVLVNDTMMTHPMHLHGLWSELEDPGGGFKVRKHTISVQPAQRVSFLVSADALGRWAWHCHLLYHMEAGMFREVVVA